jgi:hypothetical protein
MARSILPFSYPDDIFTDYSLKDVKVADVINWLLASINEEELENEHRNRSYSPPSFPSQDSSTPSPTPSST